MTSLSIVPNEPSTGFGLISFPSQKPITSADQVTEFRRFRHSDNIGKRTSKTLVTAQNPSQLFFGDSSLDDSAFNFAVGYHEPETKRITLFPIGPCIPLNFLPARTTTENATELTVREQFAELVSTFGSKKRQKVLKNRMANTLTDEALSHAAELVENLAEMNDPSVEEADPEGMAKALLPPFDTKATEPDEVFPLSSLTSIECWEALPASWIEEQPDSELWCDLVLHLIKDSSRLKEINYCKLLTLLEFLIRLVRAPNSALNSKRNLISQLGDPPRPVFTWIIDSYLSQSRSARSNVSSSYTTDSGFSMSNESKCKVYLLAAIVYLNLYNFSVDPAPFSAALNIPLNTCLFIFKQVGCTVKTNVQGIDKTHLVVLKAPLKLPDSFKVGKKFKRS
ncbi:hypothetical protein RCL1_002054 [Eukaryota sp. TZLM3-RCL]